MSKHIRAFFILIFSNFFQFLARISFLQQCLSPSYLTAFFRFRATLGYFPAILSPRIKQIAFCFACSPDKDVTFSSSSTPSFLNALFSNTRLSRIMSIFSSASCICSCSVLATSSVTSWPRHVDFVSVNGSTTDTMSVKTM